MNEIVSVYGVSLGLVDSVSGHYDCEIVSVYDVSLGLVDTVSGHHD